jgi:hypothetical protein
MSIATPFWSARSEASLNWLALVLLLAAWNASDNDAPDNARRSTALFLATKPSPSSHGSFTKNRDSDDADLPDGSQP